MRKLIALVMWYGWPIAEILVGIATVVCATVFSHELGWFSLLVSICGGMAVAEGLSHLIWHRP